MHADATVCPRREKVVEKAAPVSTRSAKRPRRTEPRLPTEPGTAGLTNPVLRSPMVLTVGLPLGGRVAINPGRPLVEMAAGRRGARALGAQKMIESPLLGRTRARCSGRRASTTPTRSAGSAKSRPPSRTSCTARTPPPPCARSLNCNPLTPLPPPRSGARSAPAPTRAASPSTRATASCIGPTAATARSAAPASTAERRRSTSATASSAATNDGPLGIALDPLTETVMWSAAGRLEDPARRPRRRRDRHRLGRRPRVVERLGAVGPRAPPARRCARARACRSTCGATRC